MQHDSHGSRPGQWPNYRGYEIELSTRRTRTGFEGAYLVCNKELGPDHVVFSGVTSRDYPKAVNAEASAFLAAKDSIDALLAERSVRQKKG